MQINLVGWQQLNRVWLLGRGGEKKGGTEGGLIVATEKRGRERSMWGCGVEGGVRCSHSQAHSSCSACWDALGSVLHNTITACSGVLCSAPLCSDCLLLDFLSSSSLVSRFACFLLCSALFFFFVFFASVQWHISSLSFLFFFLCCAFLNLLVALALKQSFEPSISISSTFVFVFMLGLGSLMLYFSTNKVFFFPFF